MHSCDRSFCETSDIILFQRELYEVFKCHTPEINKTKNNFVTEIVQSQSTIWLCFRYTYIEKDVWKTYML